MADLKRNLRTKKVPMIAIDNAAKLWESTRNEVWRVKWYKLVREWYESKTKS